MASRVKMTIPTETVCNVLFLAGLGCLIGGAFVISRAVGLIVLGLALIGISFLAYLNAKQQRSDMTHAA